MAPRRAAAVVTMAVVALTGCTNDGTGDAGPDATTPELEIPNVTVSPERLTPFCVALSDLYAQLRNDPPDDVTQAIVDTYREILPEAPSDIAVDMAAVLDALENGRPLPTAPPPPSVLPTDPTQPPSTGSTETSTDSSTDSSTGSSVETSTGAGLDTVPGSTNETEGFDAEPFELTSPSDRINDYLQLTCLDTGNNPGPPPTEPLSDG